MRICHSCGAEVQDESLFCHICGKYIAETPQNNVIIQTPMGRVKNGFFAFIKAYIYTLFFKAFTSAMICIVWGVALIGSTVFLGDPDKIYDWSNSVDGLNVMTAITYFLFIVATVGTLLILKRSVTDEFGFRKVPLYTLPLAALFGYSGNLIYMTAMNLIPWPKWIIESHMDAYGDIGADGSSLILTMVVTAVMTGIIEEIVFRGLVIPRLRRAFSPVATLIISGAFFGAAHPTLFAFCYSFILGIFLGAVYLRFNSVLPCIVLHTFFNLAACIGYPESTMFFLIAVPVCVVVHAASGTILLKTNCLMDSNKNHTN